MTIFTNVPNNLNRPQTFHSFFYLRASGSLVNIPLTVALVGTKSSAGTATAGTVYDVPDATTTDALFGASSPLALMCRKSMETSTMLGRGPRVKAVAVAEPGGGTASVYTITMVGTATADGNQIFHVAGRLFSVGIASGTSQNNTALAVANAMKAKQETLPFIVTVATNVVTLTFPTKGVNGNDLSITCDQQVAGVVATVAHPTPGVGVSDMQTGIDALAPLRYDGIAFENHAAADITEIIADIAVRWGVQSKNWGYYFIGEMGTIGTATALAAAANHQSVIVSSMEGCLSTAGEIATAIAMLVFSRERPNAGYNGAVVPLYPPLNAGTLYTGPEVETAISAGLTALNGVIDSAQALVTNRVKVERLVTSRTTTNSLPDDKNRDISTSRVGVEIAKQLDIAAEEALGSTNNPDGIPQEDSIPLIRDIASSILRAEARAKVIKPSFVDADVAGIVVESDAVTQGRNNALVPYHPNNPLMQVAWAHNVQV